MNSSLDMRQAEFDAPLARIRRMANDKRERIRHNTVLSEPQRKLALELLCQQTECEFRNVLGPREFTAYHAFHQWWFRHLSRVD